MSEEGPKQKRANMTCMADHLDKPVGMTSTHAVRREAHQRQRAGPPGIGPLASGALPIASEATAVPSFGWTLYRFTVRWAREIPTTPRGITQRPKTLGRRNPGASSILYRNISRCRRAIRPSRSRRARFYDLARDGERWTHLGRRDGRLELVHSRPGSCRAGSRMRQGHICSLPGARSRPRFGLFWPCQRPSPGISRAIRRRNHDFAGTTGGSMP